VAGAGTDFTKRKLGPEKKRVSEKLGNCRFGLVPPPASLPSIGLIRGLNSEVARLSDLPPV
jgi:hypothetical protein